MPVIKLCGIAVQSIIKISFSTLRFLGTVQPITYIIVKIENFAYLNRNVIKSPSTQVSACFLTTLFYFLFYLPIAIMW